MDISEALENILTGKPADEYPSPEVVELVREALAYGEGMAKADTAFRITADVDALKMDVAAVKAGVESLVSFVNELQQMVMSSPLAAMMGGSEPPTGFVVPGPGASMLPPGYRPPRG